MTPALELTTVVGCSNACSFCPQQTLVRNYQGPKSLAWQVFALAIERIPRHVRIHFSGYAEPFLNPAAAAMARYTRERGHGLHLYTTLVGFQVENVADIRIARPDRTVIHVPDTQAFRFADDRWIAHHEAWLKVGLPVTSYISMGPVTDTLREYLRKHEVVVSRPSMVSRAGNIRRLAPHLLTGSVTCAMNRWHQNVMLPNADVYLCCMDYSLTAPLGNLLDHSYEEIYGAAERYRNNCDPPMDSICRKCEWATPSFITEES